MFKKLIPFGFVLIFNLWIWKIFSTNIALGLITLITSIFLWFSIKTTSKYFSYLFILLAIILLFFQWQTTQRFSLTYLDNDEQRVQQMRLKEYPPVYIKVGEKIIWIHVANWFELRKESVAFYRIERNFSEVIDPNLYFFANHPRERVGIKEFEKFPYILLPVFLIGIFALIRNRSFVPSRTKKLALFSFSFILPIFLISLIGHINPSGPFTIFPFLAVTASLGLEEIYKKISKLPKFSKALVIILSLTLFLLVFLQMISYAKY